MCVLVGVCAGMRPFTYAGMGIEMRTGVMVVVGVVVGVAMCSGVRVRGTRLHYY